MVNGRANSFNRKWGLHTPVAVTIAKGSVFLCEGKPPSLENLNNGLGELTAEGYGRAAIDFVSPGEWTPIAAQCWKPESTSSPLNADDQRLLDLMRSRNRERLLDQALAAAVLKAIPDTQALIGWPTNHQMARLRAVCRQAMDCEDVLTYLRDLKPAGQRQFIRARLEGERLLQWLNQCLAHPEEVWKRLEIAAEGRFPEIDQNRSEALQERYAIRFIDGLLALVTKSDRTEGATAK